MSIVKTKLAEALFRAWIDFVSSLSAIPLVARTGSHLARASMGVSCVARDNAVEGFIAQRRAASKTSPKLALSFPYRSVAGACPHIQWSGSAEIRRKCPQ